MIRAVPIALTSGCAGLALAGLIALAGEPASEPVTGGIVSQPLKAGITRNTGLRFRQLPADQTGVDFVYRWNPAPRYERLLNSSVVGGGVCVGDYDGDGLPDLCLTRPADGFRLYRNLGDFRFSDVTERAGIRDDSLWTTGASFADVNNDGRLDLYVCCYEAPNRLFINRGNGTFTEQAAALGLNFSGASMMVAFADYDRDGRLDAYLLTAGLMPGPAQKFRVNFVNGRPVVPEDLAEYWQLFYLPGERASMAEAGQRDRLFHQETSGRFTEVSQAARIAGCDFGNAAVWWDYDHDGWPDLYVANDYFGPDRLHRNNGNGTFTDVAHAAFPSTPWTSMGADVADFNNDGRFDLIASDMSGTTRFKRLIDSGDMERAGWFLDWAEPRQYLRNALFINTGMNRFLEVAQLAGLAHTDWTWSIVSGDLDADGREDIFVPNGMTRDWMDNDLAMQSKGLAPAEYAQFWRRQPVRRDRNLAFRNLGDLQFTNVASVWGLDHEGPSFGAVLADLDDDGRLDLVVNDFEAPARIYRNEGPSGNRVTVRLGGTTSNRSGVGAVARIETATGTQTRCVTLSRGFMSATEPVAHFGVGPNEKITRLSVEWPSGHRQEFINLEVNRRFEIAEPAGPAPARAPGPPGSPLFSPSTRFANVRHTATPVDDFQQQPLLPWKLSESGPGMAWADVDGGSTQEFYLCGSSQHPSALYRRSADGTFLRDTQTGITTTGEELAPLFFEANGDGLPDLIIVNSRPGVTLHLNQGQGRFKSAAAEALPTLADACGAVAAADFDRDGDLDLFLGGRSQPGRYPLPAGSHLWRNDTGVFRDVTAERAPGLNSTGRVVAALWTDADNDGWPDLMLTTEWGPVRLFRNRNGQLIESTEEADLARRLGWWTGIAAGDFDRDGDLDYVVGNLGLNTRYQPSEAEPCLLYWGAFGGNPEPHVIEAVTSAAGVYPLRGKTALEKAVPSIAERFPTHHAFAAAKLPQLVGENELTGAVRVEANTAESGVLVNDGCGRFAFQPLPRLAQASPVFGVAVADLDGDGFPDVCLAQNFSGVQRETGRMNGGAGAVLLGRGDGTFTSAWPDRSGVLVPEDGRSTVVTDFTGDGWPDLAVATHNGNVRGFENRAQTANRQLSVRLQGRASNPTAVGARVTLLLNSGVRLLREVHAGAGYWSQSGGILHFGLGGATSAREIEVRWPDGTVTRQQEGLSGPDLLLRQP